MMNHKLSVYLNIFAISLLFCIGAQAAPSLLFSTSSDRSAPRSLAGATVAGNIYVFIGNDAGVQNVAFYLDDPMRVNPPRQTEGLAPFDFGGTAVNGNALPYDTNNLSNKQHSIDAYIKLSTGSTVTLKANFTVSNGDDPSISTYTLMISSHASRSSPAALNGRTLSGDVYIFVHPADGVREVKFYLDDPSRTRPPRQTEALAPFDFNGTAATGYAQAYDTKEISDSNHSITAVVSYNGGTKEVSASFTVFNSSPPPTSVQLRYSTQPSRSSSALLANASLSGSVYIFTTPDTGVKRVDFYLDDPNRTHAPRQTEALAPFDFAGTAGDASAYAFNLSALAAGAHEVTAVVTHDSGSESILHAPFSVGSNSTSYSLLFSKVANRSSASPLQGAIVSDNIYVFTAPDSGVSSVAFHLDDIHYRTENLAPFDFAGTASDSSFSAQPFNTKVLNNGTHSITATIVSTGGARNVLTASFNVSNSDNNTDYLVEDFNDGQANGWYVYNDTSIPSNWRVSSGKYIQSERVSGVNKSYLTGSYAYYSKTASFTDCKIKVSFAAHDANNDATGIMFRYRDNSNYYRFVMSRRQGWRRVEKKVNGKFYTLAYDGRPTQTGRSSTVNVDLRGSHIYVYVDGYAIFGVNDSSLSSGTVALFSQGLCEFDNVEVTDSPKVPKVMITYPFGFSIHTTDDDPGAGTVNAAAVADNVPAGGGVSFILTRGNQDWIRVDKSAPYTAQFSGLSRGNYDLEAFVVNSSDLPVQGDLAYDINKEIGLGGKKFVCLGNSITRGYGDNYTNDDNSADGRNLHRGYQPVLNNRLTSTYSQPVMFYNEGLGGTTSAHGLYRIESTIERYPDAQYWLILFGVNDALLANPPRSGAGLNPGQTGYADSFKDVMQQLVTRILREGGIPVLLHVPIIFGPSSNASPFSNPSQAPENWLIQEYNEAIDEIVQNNRLPVSSPDLYNYFAQHPQEYADNLHPNGTGYQSIARLIHNTLDNSGIYP